MTQAEVITKLKDVDLVRGVATYEVFKPIYTTIYTTFVRYVTQTLRTHYSIITAVRRTYVLPDGSVYTVLNIPTRITVTSKVETIPS